jgi:hypothetical protein
VFAVSLPSIRLLVADTSAAAPALATRRSGAAGRRAGLLRRVAVAIAVLWLGAAQALAAGGGRPESSLANHADTSGLAPGLARSIAELYNHSLWLYGLTVVVVMAAMGLILGLLTDRFMTLLGVDLGRTARHE